MKLNGVHKNYDLNSILQGYKFQNFDRINFNQDLNSYYETQKKINKPDFIAIFDLGNSQTIRYQKNYNLKFNPGSTEELQDIINNIDTKQAEKIKEIDMLAIPFVKEHQYISRTSIFQLRFTCNLFQGQAQTLLRNISYIDLDRPIEEPPLLCVTFTDVTELVGLHHNPKFIIRNVENIDDKIFNTKISEFSKKVNVILEQGYKITKRERQILTLIAKGKTSKEISEELSISPKTVNTHRQNLIKKFKVKNTAALINLKNL